MVSAHRRPVSDHIITLAVKKMEVKTAGQAKAQAAFGAATTGSIGTVPLSPTGIANAARVSYGSEHDVWSGLTGYLKTPVRHESEHITITVVLYNVVAGGVPSEADVAAAIDDLERLYAACAADRRAAIAFANAPVASPWAPATADPALAVRNDELQQVVLAIVN